MHRRDQTRTFSEEHLAFHLSKLLYKVNLSSVSDTPPITAMLENLTPTFPEFSTTFSTLVLQMRGGEDEMWPPEDIWWLFCPLTSPLLSLFSFPLLFLNFLFFSLLSYPLFADLKFFSVSLKQALIRLMMQTYFG